MRPDQHLFTGALVFMTLVLSTIQFAPRDIPLHQPKREQHPTQHLFSSTQTYLDTLSRFGGYTAPDSSLENACVLTNIFGSSERKLRFMTQELGRDIVRLSRSELPLPSPLRDRLTIGDLYHDLGEFMVLRHRGSRDFLDKNLMPTVQHLENYIQQGGSAVISVSPPPSTTSDPVFEKSRPTTQRLWDLKVSAEESLGRSTSINIYHSGPSAVALNRHYDSYDVIVVQVEGCKDWEIQESDGVWKNTTLTPGDVLYLPQGVWHAATTTEGFPISTHVTIGLL